MKKIFAYLTKPLILFYVVFVYIIIFSVWWSFLLFDKNRIAFEEKVELQAIGEGLSKNEFRETEDFVVLYEKFCRQRIMIITEGITFLALILIGLFMVRKSFIRELDLANQQRNFLLSITHELKSPLAGIKLSIQTLLNRTLEKEKQNKLLANSLEDVDRLEGLVENILLAAKFDNPSYGFALEDVELSLILRSVLKQMRAKYKGYQIDIREEIDDTVIFQGDKLALSSVIINLVENAFKYSNLDQNPLISVRLREMQKQVEFQISDNGPGIEESDKNRVFEKFYRVGSENTRKTKGTGLGLFIVKRVVNMYEGTIQVKDNKPKGTTFIVRLPKVNSMDVPDPVISAS